MGNISTYTYDVLGRLKTETAPHAPSGAANTTAYEYDVLGRVKQITDPLNRKTTLTYDALGQIKTVTDAKNGVTTFEYDANGNIISAKDALNNESTFGYDSMNRLVRANTPNGEVTLYTYNERGLVTRIVDPSRGTVTAVYDKNGNLFSETDANGNITEYEYDALSRVKKIAYDDGQTVSYAYNLAGQLTALTDWTGTTAFTSDLLGQLLTVTDPNNLVTAYEWDNAGNRKSVTAPDSSVVTYEYNGNNQMTKAVTSDGITAYDYFDSTLLKSVALPNGERTNYTYNPNGKRISEEHSLNGAVRRTYGYTYDELERLTAETHANVGVALEPMPSETYTYQYDALDRLTYFKGSNGETTNYTYDAAGNLKKEVSSLVGTTEYTYSGNRLTAKTAPDGSYAYTYDNAGNMLTETKNGALNKTLTYDATGRFVLGGNADGDTSEYVYNGLGYRVENTTTRRNPNYAYQNSIGSEGSEYLPAGGEWTYFDETGKVRQSETAVTTKTYTPDFTTGGLRDIMVAEAGMFAQTYSYGLGLISVDTAADASAEPSVQQLLATEYNPHYFAHQNRLGGESYYTDAAGKLLSYNEFDAWGNAYTAIPEDINANGLNNGLGFTGYTWDAVLDVWFAQARMYDAGSKRFLAVDPVGGDATNPISLNPYLYCQSDPVNNIDPTGMWMPGDETRSAEKQAEIAVYTQQWNAAHAKGDAAGMAAANGAAEAVRNRPDSTPSPIGNGNNSAAYQQWAGITANFPPSDYTILVGNIAKAAPSWSLEKVMKVADYWTASVEMQRNPIIGQMYMGTQTMPIKINDSKYEANNPIVYQSLQDLNQSWIYLHCFEMSAKSSNEITEMRRHQQNVINLMTTVRSIGDEKTVKNVIIPGLSATEEVIYASNTGFGLNMSLAGYDAINFGTRFYDDYADPNYPEGTYNPGTTWTGNQNAFQHTYWGFAGAMSTSIEYATLYMNAHEYGISSNFSSERKLLETQMDFYNNNLGYELQSEYDPKTGVIAGRPQIPHTALYVLNAIRDGRAARIANGMLVPTGE